MIVLSITCWGYSVIKKGAIVSANIKLSHHNIFSLYMNSMVLEILVAGYLINKSMGWKPHFLEWKRKWQIIEKTYRRAYFLQSQLFVLASAQIAVVNHALLSKLWVKNHTHIVIFAMPCCIYNDLGQHWLVCSCLTMHAYSRNFCTIMHFFQTFHNLTTSVLCWITNDDLQSWLTNVLLIIP